MACGKKHNKKETCLTLTSSHASFSSLSTRLVWSGVWGTSIDCFTKTHRKTNTPYFKGGMRAKWARKMHDESMCLHWSMDDSWTLLWSSFGLAQSLGGSRSVVLLQKQLFTLCIINTKNNLRALALKYHKSISKTSYTFSIKSLFQSLLGYKSSLNNFLVNKTPIWNSKRPGNRFYNAGFIFPSV